MRKRAAAPDASVERVSGARKPPRVAPKHDFASVRAFGSPSHRCLFVSPTDS
jgi:hypothetical protein